MFFCVFGFVVVYVFIVCLKHLLRLFVLRLGQPLRLRMFESCMFDYIKNIVYCFVVCYATVVSLRVLHMFVFFCVSFVPGNYPLQIVNLLLLRI